MSIELSKNDNLEKYVYKSVALRVPMVILDFSVISYMLFGSTPCRNNN